jgi:hypothetical protein
LFAQSGKATLLNTLLETIIEKGEKVLIFTQVGNPHVLLAMSHRCVQESYVRIVGVILLAAIQRLLENCLE